MNTTVLFGLISVNVVFLASMIIALGGVGAFIDPPSALIVFGGTISATLISVPLNQLKSLMAAIKSKILFNEKIKYIETIDQIISIAKAQKKGASAFDQAKNGVSNEFLRDAAGVLFWAEAEISEAEFRDLLDARAATHFKATHRHSKAFRVISKFPPSFGMMGTIVGLVALLQSLGDPDAKSKIGPAMAVALITTLYGIALNNLFVIPVSENLNKRGEEELLNYTLIVEGIVLIQQNKPTKYIEEKLNSYLMPELRSLQKA